MCTPLFLIVINIIVATRNQHVAALTSWQHSQNKLIWIIKASWVVIDIYLYSFSIRIASPVHSNSGPRPSTSSHTSCLSFNLTKLEMIRKIQEADETKSNIKVRVCAPIFFFPPAGSSFSLGLVSWWLQVHVKWCIRC